MSKKITKPVAKKAPAKRVTRPQTSAPVSSRPVTKPSGGDSTRKAGVGKRIISAFVHYVKGSSAYMGLSYPHYGALLPAALVIAGFAEWDAKSQVLKPSKGGGSREVMKELIGDRPFTHHAKEGRIDASTMRLTEGGALWFNARLSGGARGNAGSNGETVAKVLAAMQKGGKVDSLNFSRKVEVVA